MCAFQTDLSILKDYDTDFFQARSSEKRTLIERTEVFVFLFCSPWRFEKTRARAEKNTKYEIRFY